MIALVSPSFSPHNYLPLISIVIPSLNQGKYISEAIDSIINQSYPNIEIIVIDGASSDGTMNILNRYPEGVLSVLSEPDGGQSDALNKGFLLAKGEIFGWLNADDKYYQDCLWVAAEVFNKDKNAKVVYGDWLSIDADGYIIQRNYAFKFSLGQMIYEDFHINAQAMFWRSSSHRRFGDFSVDIKYVMDYQLIVGIGFIEGGSAFHRVDKVMGCFRRHEDQKSIGFTENMLNEHKALALRYGYTDKYSFTGVAKWFAYKVRRFYFICDRAGLIFGVEKGVMSMIKMIRHRRRWTG